jgi:hypothetical protein
VFTVGGMSPDISSWDHGEEDILERDRFFVEDFVQFTLFILFCVYPLYIAGRFFGVLMDFLDSLRGSSWFRD